MVGLLLVLLALVLHNVTGSWRPGCQCQCQWTPDSRIWNLQPATAATTFHKVNIYLSGKPPDL